jgi:uncharacterized protein with GYD domain
MVEEEWPMPFYMIQWSYESAQVKALVEKPHDRESEFKKLVEAFEGRLHSYFFTFGDYDGAAILEFPNATTCAACVMNVAGTGAVAKVKTTVLLTPDESVAAMRKAKAARHGYVTPSGYSSHG